MTAQLSRERLEEIRDYDTCVTIEESAEMARMLLAGMSSEPVTVPHGWALVPTEPNSDMCFAPDVYVGAQNWEGRQKWATIDECAEIYKSMIAEAPPAPTSERERIRAAHAEWAAKTFGNTGPVGPLKHLSKEALEAAEAPWDLHEWADMQFLLWDAQRRAGISDGEITAALEEKLKVNMARQWPEPKDGEPRLHVKPEEEV